jgi:hypothetical protein
VNLRERISGIILSLVAVAVATASVFFEEVHWNGPTISMAEGGYLAWPVIRIALLVAAVFITLQYATPPHALVIAPLTVVIVMIAALQATRAWWLLDLALLAIAFAFLWRAYFQISRHRDRLGMATQLFVVTPIGLTAGWITVSLFSAIAAGVWTFEDLRIGAIATAWQAALLVVMLLFIGFGIEQTRAHPSYAAGALWGALAIAVGSADTQDTTVMIVAVVVSLITVALFFIERAMFRFRGTPQPRVDH